MDPTTLLQNATSNLCTKLLDDIRDLRSACALTACCLSKSKTNRLTEAPSTLCDLTARLRAQEQPLILLRNEIEAPFPLEDLRELSKSAQDAIYEMQLILQSSGRRTLSFDLLCSIAEDLDHLHETAINLARACQTLDDELCPHPHRWSDGGTPLGVELSMRRAFHAQLIQKLSSEGRQCPICLEEMVDGTKNDPTITKCGHMFCEECIEIVIEEQQKCPICRRGLVYSLLFR